MAEAALRRHAGTDALVAAAAGPLVWSARPEQRDPIETASTVTSLLALAGQACTVAALSVWNPAGLNAIGAFGGAACCVLSLLVPASQQIWLFSGHRLRASTTAFIVVRVAALAAFSVGWMVIASGFAVALAWPLGIYVGVEYAHTNAAIGRRSGARSLLRRMLVSPMHVGLLMGLLVAAVLGIGDDIVVALEFAMFIETIMFFAMFSYWSMNRVARAERRSIRGARDDERMSERRRRAHWIHDDVCADLRTVRIKLATQEMSREQVATELDELDYRMRVRQLDEILEGGCVSAAEVLQPYLRRAQNAGVRLVEVPRYEDASLEVPAVVAALLRRSIAGLVANAVAAGTTTLAIRLRHDDRALDLVVEDDAGGFELDTIPAGRGLSKLMNDVGPGSLEVDQGPVGAIVTIRIPLDGAP